MMERVYFRALEKSDIDLTHKWHNDPELYKTLGGVFRYISRSSEERWLDSMTKPCSNSINLAICLHGNDEHVGNIYVRNIDWINKHGELHIFIGDKNDRIKGIGTEAGALIEDYCFNHLGLHRLYAYIIADNKAVKNLASNFNWQVEGMMRKHIFKKGKFKDVAIIGKCKND